MTRELSLQTILGADKRNPLLTLCCDNSNPGEIYFFFGAALLEVVPYDRKNLRYKLPIARLYKAGVKARALANSNSTPSLFRREAPRIFITTRIPNITWTQASESTGAAKILKGWCPKVRAPHKALELRRQEIKTHLGKVLVRKLLGKRKDSRREEKIMQLTHNLTEVECEIARTQKQISRLHL